MVKYFLITDNRGYWPIIHSDLYTADNVCIFGGFTSILINTVFRMHFAWPLNIFFELPFHRIWFKHFFHYNHNNISSEPIFVFYELSNLAFSRKYLGYLKSKYPRAKYSFVFSNPTNSYNIMKLQRTQKYYDRIVVFSEEDAIKYGWDYYNNGVYSKITLPESNLPYSDLFFIGKNKGRIALLLSIFERMTRLGIKCDFFITEVPKDEQKYSDKIFYNKKITYEQVIQHVKKTKCVLEIIQDKKNYSSLRTYEAFAYDKKLLTTNKLISTNSLYCEKNMRYFSKASEIDINFIIDPYQKVNFSDEIYSPENFLKFIEEKIKETKNKF